MSKEKGKGRAPGILIERNGEGLRILVSESVVWVVVVGALAYVLRHDFEALKAIFVLMAKCLSRL